MIRILVVIYILMLAPVQVSAQLGGYFRRDFQYFKPTIANIRRSHTHMRFYRHEEVEFTRSSASAMGQNHNFWDVAFGGFYSLAGYNRTNPTNPMRISGYAIFVEPDVHMLLDFSAGSAAIINSDFRIGGGFTWRFSDPFAFLSGRLKFFHESTHLGDEFVLDAQDLNDFRRYNVSYKALELYQALDGFPQANLYMRGYGGYRFIDKTEYEDFREFEQPPPLKGGKHEFQFGVEFVLGAASSGMINNAFSALRVGPVAHYVLAFDLYSRHQYAINNPKRVLGKNVVLGLIWGSYFQAHLGKHSIALLLNFYDGPNPHGQFRKEDLTYLGADISIGF